jgi:AbiJ N-terminal domain 4
MPVFETYASRVAAAAKAGASDVYTYDQLPPFLRKQISKIFADCIGPGVKDSVYDPIEQHNANAVWEQITETMDKEVPSFLFEETGSYAYGHCRKYLLTSNDVEGVLSLIEICAQVIEELRTSFQEVERRWGRGATQDPADALVELNERLLRAGVGYQFENGQIIRVDSQYVHAEVVKEALRLLSEQGFGEANDEFVTAHRHLREGKLRDCNTAALRAMETVLKVICDARGWTYQKGDTVERLLAIVCREGLFPDYLGGYFNNLVGAMKAGVPKIRDRQGGHGAAPGDDPLPDHIAAFALHLTAANIVMLVKAHRAQESTA